MAEPNFENRTLYHHDNLVVLRGMNSNSVHLIATDPPFNKSRDFHATPDSLASGASFQDRWSWRDDIHDDWLIEIQRDYPEVWSVITAAKQVYGDDMGAFLCWLGVRLLEMHRVLREDGSLYLHIDHTAHAYVKTLTDAVFGKANFRNEIIWFYKTGGVSRRWFSRKHDTILFYTKSDDYPFTQQKEKSYLSHKYGFSNVDIQEDDQGHFTMVGMRDVWDIPALRGNQPETTGYPTQKPLALYERIIKASSDEGDLVLDPFAGCATTPVAAERLGRHWIAIDVWDGAIDVVRQRMEDNRQLLGDIPVIHYATEPPTRSDNGEPAVLVLQTPQGRPRRYPPPRQQRDRLSLDLGAYCQGCGRDYGFDPRVLEVDHVSPKADGGTDAYENLTLLCPPCNREKRDRMTLSGLQQFNRDNGYLLRENESNIKRGRASRTRRRRRR